VQPDMVTGAQAQPSTDATGQVADGLLGLSQVLPDSAGVGQQCRTCFGQADTPADAVEQGGNALADRGLGYMQLLCSRRK